MSDEIDLDVWLDYFRHQVRFHTNERDFLIQLHTTTHSRFEQLLSGPRERLLDNAREFLRERMQYQIAMDTKLRLCRREAKNCKQKNPEDPRCKDLADLCRQLHIITTQVLPYIYGKEEEFLKTVLTPDEYEGLRQDVIKDTLLAGKMTRGEA
jgi:hypothetical protein